MQRSARDLQFKKTPCCRVPATEHLQEVKYYSIKLYVTLAWGGLIYSLGALVIEYLSGKNTGKCNATCPQLWFSEMLCISLDAESSAWSLRKEHPSEGRTGPGHPGYTFHVLCWSLTLTTAHLHRASPPDTTATGMNLPCGENQTHHPLPNAHILW